MAKIRVFSMQQNLFNKTFLREQKTKMHEILKHEINIQVIYGNLSVDD